VGAWLPPGARTRRLRADPPGRPCRPADPPRAQLWDRLLPPIAAYDRDVAAELDTAARGYLEATVDYDPDAGVARVPRVLLWFVGDFGGPAGVRDALREYGVIPGDASPRLRALPWDWSPSLDDYADR